MIADLVKAGLGGLEEVELPEWLGEALYSDENGVLIKGAGHKYLRRVPKAGGGWRYFYNVTGGHGLGHHSEMVRGAAFKITDAGREGHFHILEDHGDEVTLRHDETGKTSRVSKKALAGMLHAEHAEAVGKVRARVAANLEQAKKTGTAKQQERAAALVSKYAGASEGGNARLRLARMEIEGERIFEGLPERVNGNPVNVEIQKNGILISFVNSFGGAESILVLDEPRAHSSKMIRVPTVALMWGQERSGYGELTPKFLSNQIKTIKNSQEGPQDIIDYNIKNIENNIQRRDLAWPKEKQKYQEDIDHALGVLAQYGADTDIPGAREVLPEQESVTTQDPASPQEAAPSAQGLSIMDRLRRNRTQIDPKTQAAIDKNTARQHALWEAFKADPRPVHFVLRDALANITRKTEGGLVVRQDLATRAILDLTKPEMEEILKLIAFDVIKNKEDAQQVAYRFHKKRDLMIDYRAREKLLDAFSKQGLSEYMKKNGKAHRSLSGTT